tara:strand:+ start:30868 stop:31254 length:387 start_codon:yes stop_codon:yes gene_type:complete
MKTDFATSWKASTQRRKQRKYVHNAPLHTRRKMLSAPLAKPLKTKYKISNIPVRSGDKVKVVRGQFKGQRGKVDIVKLAQLKICIEGLQQVKKDGSKAYFPIHPSNVLVEELNLDDKKRRMKLEGVKQ